MRSLASRFSALLIAIVLVTGVFAPPAFAADREASRDPVNPIIRVIKQAGKFIVSALEIIGVPKP